MEKLFLAFGYALNGLARTIRNERNFQIECCCAGIVIAAGIFFDISHTRWLICIINIGFVLSAELFNTSIEKLCNRITTDIDPAIKIIKDVSAAAVLISSLSAAACAAVIFIPHIGHLIKLL